MLPLLKKAELKIAQKTWFDGEIAESISKRDKLFHKT